MEAAIFSLPAPFSTGTLTTFRKTVTTAGTAEQITSTSTPCEYVILNAPLGNTGDPVVVVGDASVVAANATQRGIVLVPGNDPVRVNIANLNLLYVDVQTNGNAVCGAYFS